MRAYLQKLVSRVMEKPMDIAKYRIMETKLDYLCMTQFDVCSVEMEEDAAGIAAAAFDPTTGQPVGIFIGNVYSGDSKIVERIICLAHEIGHLKDYVEHYHRSYRPMERDKYHPVDSVFQEIRAWVHGIAFLQNVRFDRWDIFETLMDRHLRSYCPNEEVYAKAKEKVLEKLHPAYQPEKRAKASV